MSDFEPLRITAHLECGIVCDRFLPIDSIIRYQIMRDRYGQQDFTLPGQERFDKSHEDPLPLRKVRDRKRDWQTWYYAASFAVWPEHVAEGSDHWVKKFDSRFLELLEQKKMARLNVGSGRYRGYHMPVFYRVAESVAWYVVGDKERIRELLATVTHLGKKTSQGWGSVSRWTVEPHAEDWSCWRDGKPMRAIPRAGGMLYGVRPSYWNPENQTECILPE